MEAATPLRRSHVPPTSDSLRVTASLVEDETAARVVRERAEAGEDPAQTVADAVEIGARVLDREQAAANAEFVKTEFERASREVEERVHRTRAQGRRPLGREGRRGVRRGERPPRQGAGEAVLRRQLGLGAEPRPRARGRDAHASHARTCCKQFSSADGSNPLADFKTRWRRSARAHEAPARHPARAARASSASWRRSSRRCATRSEKLEEVEAERERGTAKGRTYEEQVAEAVDAIASAQGDDCRRRRRPAGAWRQEAATCGRRGRVLRARAGPHRGRGQGQRLSQARGDPVARRGAGRARGADFAVLVVPTEEEVPPKLHAAARVQRRQAGRDLRPRGLDAGARARLPTGSRPRPDEALSEPTASTRARSATAIERALQAMEEVRKVKSQLTGAKTSIDKAYGMVETRWPPGCAGTWSEIDDARAAAR